MEDVHTLTHPLKHKSQTRENTENAWPSEPLQLFFLYFFPVEPINQPSEISQVVFRDILRWHREHGHYCGDVLL